MKKYLIFFSIFFLFFNWAHSSPNKEIINHLKTINTLEFKFIQRIDNNNVEIGKCKILYPKKIFCQYDDIYNKILVSNGKSLFINSDNMTNYLRYSLSKTPLNFILDKEFLISKMSEVNIDADYPFYYVFNFEFESNYIKIFFDKESLDLIGWQTKDIYQNTIQTFISDIEKNNIFDDKLFVIQKYIN